MTPLSSINTHSKLYYCNTSFTTQTPPLSLSLSLSTHTYRLSMAISKALIASVLLSLLLVHGVQSIQTNQVTGNAVSETGYSSKIDCGGACAARCKLSGRPNLCKRACGTCCARCNCVPPGTYGNHEACPCYAKLTTRHNKPKCP